jgi:hypothetical protein
MWDAARLEQTGAKDELLRQWARLGRQMIQMTYIIMMIGQCILLD